MIDLVLDAHREQPFCFEFERLSAAVQGGNHDALRALHVFEDAGERQAPFLGFPDTGGPSDFGIDKAQRLASLRGDVDRHDAFRRVNLRRSQTDSTRGVHCFEHVVDQPPDVIVDSVNGFGASSQARVRIVENVEKGHFRFLWAAGDMVGNHLSIRQAVAVRRRRCRLGPRMLRGPTRTATNAA